MAKQPDRTNAKRAISKQWDYMRIQRSITGDRNTSPDEQAQVERFLSERGVTRCDPGEAAGKDMPWHTTEKNRSAMRPMSNWRS